MSEKLVLIDGHSILNRAYHGIPALTNSKGIYTNAVYGFLNIMFKILEEEKPDYLTVAFDVHEPTFRHKMFDGYKGTRKPMDEELRQQVPLMKDMLRAMGVRVVEFPGFEADDILGTLSVMGEQNGMQVSVVSGDRDLLQLATDRVMIRIPKTKKTGTEIENYLAEDVKSRYQVTPKEFIDLKALMGDASDNIPGVPGIGEKTAMELIAHYGSIEAVHENAAVIKPPRASKNIVEFWEQAVMSKELATIIVDAPLTEAPVEYDFAQARISGVESLYTQDAFLLCKELEFKNFLPRFQKQTTTPAVKLVLSTVTTRDMADQVWEKAKGHLIGFAILEDGTADGKRQCQEADGQLSLFASVIPEDAFLGMSISFGPEDNYFMPCGNYQGIATGSELTSSYLIEKLVAHDGKVSALSLKPALKYIPSLGYEAGLKDFAAYENRRKNYEDCALAAYLLNPTLGEYPYDFIGKNYLDMILPSQEELLGKKCIGQAAEENLECVQQFSCYEAYVAGASHKILMEQLTQKGMLALYQDIELPLVYVLGDMEQEGIALDVTALQEYSNKLGTGIAELEDKIYREAGEEFNINSPKQLGVILFEKLALPGAKKTKTGYSTSADVLEKLAGEYPVVADILEYRQLTKLKSTYADGLQNYVQEDGRIHTTFNQTITATGRLSSAEPNLQNIPIRIELGKMIRRVFQPKENYLFVDSDYSQIELRVLAHMAQDENMILAFADGKDIHRATASQVFHVPFDEVTDLQRRGAKAVNFGIVYGISAFGLAEDLGIERKEAQAYIDSYFKTYPKIREFLDQTVESARKTGEITTLFGRIRPIPELASSNFMQRQFGERVAMNSPIQGTAADIIKIAMIRVHDALLQEKFASRLILQVHDELLLETARDEEAQVIALLEREMKAACDLAVELEVGTAVGANWYDAH